jgi:hypothetical protein
MSGSTGMAGLGRPPAGIGREVTPPRLHARDPALEVLHNPWAEHDSEWLDRDQGGAALSQYRAVRKTYSHRGNCINQVRLAMVGWWSQADTHDFSCLDQFVFQCPATPTSSSHTSS